MLKWYSTELLLREGVLVRCIEVHYLTNLHSIYEPLQLLMMNVYCITNCNTDLLILEVFPLSNALTANKLLLCTISGSLLDIN